MVGLRGELLSAVVAAASGGSSPVAERARRILEDSGYQRALPKDPAPVDLHAFSLGPFEQLVRILLWVALAVVVVIALAWLYQRLRGRTADVAVEPDAAPAPLQVSLNSAERLAAAGRYAEAIHVLLLETLAALSRAAQLAPSLTSREIVARVRLPARAREALVALVLAVEVSRFGGAPAGQPEYRACLDRFREFLETYHRPAPRAEGTAA